MLKIRLDKVGKRFNRGWVFKGISCEIKPDEPMVVLGSNGSGKSTLLRIISGSLTPSHGEIFYELDGHATPVEELYQNVSIAAPYLDLIQEYTLEEHIEFHFKFKQLVEGVALDHVPDMLNLHENKSKPLKQYSSGMVQRVKLGLAILSKTPMLLLDEPSTNLDAKGIVWYNELLKQFAVNRTVVICSNERTEEYQFCVQELSMENYK
ncbi:MAG: ATP-binding cassette domain-containing protein [Flavobacteriales bacterium]|nr:ATP-binding cassette domain-containing protein [Flavobacteriales bacterium]